MSRNFEFDAREVLNNLSALERKFDRRAKDLLEVIGRTEVETGAKEIIKSAGHVVTGNLKASIKVMKVTSTYCKVGTKVKYAKYVHRITPYMTMALERAKAPLRAGIADIFRNIKF